MSKGSLKEGDLFDFISKNNPNLDKNYVSRVVRTYIDESQKEGVNHDIAIAQMLLETGYLNYQGVVSRSQNNFGGIGAVGGQSTGASFTSLEEGIRAHIQHLKAYASTKMPESPLADPRFFLVKRGSARTFYELTGRWATDEVYHQKIENILEKALVSYGVRS